MSVELETIPDSLQTKYDEIFAEAASEPKAAESRGALHDAQRKADIQDAAYIEEQQADKYLEKLADKDKENQGEQREETEEELADELGEKESGQELSEPAGAEDEKTEPIPDNLVQAGRAYGLTDETIIGLSESHPDALEAITRSYERLRAGSVLAPEQAPPKQPEQPKPMEHISVDVSALDEDSGKTIKGMESTVNKLVDANNELRKELFTVKGGLQTTQQAEQLRRVSYIDGLFDKVSDFPELGKSSSLANSQKALRGEVYDMAISWQRRNGGTFEQSLDRASQSFRGLYGHSGVKTKESDVLAKLNKRKQKFTARPTGQKTTQRFASEEAKAMTAMNEMGKKIDLW